MSVSVNVQLFTKNRQAMYTSLYGGFDVPSVFLAAGFSLAYSLATTIGGATPAVVTFLIHEAGNHAPGARIQRDLQICTNRARITMLA